MPIVTELPAHFPATGRSEIDAPRQQRMMS
jgi:hypothetical protein